MEKQNKYNSYYSDKNGNEYNDFDMWELANQHNFIDVAPNMILDQLSKEEQELIATMLCDYKRIRDCDLQYPIIITPDGYLADGYHRLIKALLEERNDIKVVNLKNMPEPRRK